jgi:hypothetical protein
MAKKAMIETWEQSMPVESALFVAFVVLLFMAFAVALAWAQWHAGAAEQDSATLHPAE